MLDVEQVVRQLLERAGRGTIAKGSASATSLDDNDASGGSPAHGVVHLYRQRPQLVAAAAAIEDPNRADHLLLLGMLLHYDGHADLAEKCFKRSAELDRNLKLSAYVSENEI